MPRKRLLQCVALVAVMYASLGGSVGYALYLRSDRYREACARDLSDIIDLPASIGRVVPRSRSAREFQDVVVGLDGVEVLRCKRAIVRYLDDVEYVVQIVGGESEISSRTWLRDYRRVVESGLRPGLGPGGLRRVDFRDMDLRFERGAFQLSLQGAGGSVVFEDESTGTASITCSRLNGQPVATPVSLFASFSARADGVQIDQVSLNIPELRVSQLGLGALLGQEVTRGVFEGRLTRNEVGSASTTVISGRCADLDLAELTRGWAPKPIRGVCPEMTLNELRVENGRPTRLEFSGLLKDLSLGDLLEAAGAPAGNGAVTLRVRSARLSPDGVEHFVASGRCRGFSLTDFTTQLGRGKVTGVANADIAELVVDENRLSVLTARAIVEEPKDELNAIDGELLRSVASEMLGFELPDILPERVEYVQLGVELSVEDETLWIRGVHGPDRRVILTVRQWGRDLPLLVEPEEPFDLSPLLDQVRARLRQAAQERLLRMETEGEEAAGT